MVTRVRHKEDTVGPYRHPVPAETRPARERDAAGTRAGRPVRGRYFLDQAATLPTLDTAHGSGDYAPGTWQGGERDVAKDRATCEAGVRGV